MYVTCLFGTCPLSLWSVSHVIIANGTRSGCVLCASPVALRYFCAMCYRVQRFMQILQNLNHKLTHDMHAKCWMGFEFRACAHFITILQDSRRPLTSLSLSMFKGWEWPGNEDKTSPLTRKMVWWVQRVTQTVSCCITVGHCYVSL